MEKTLTSKLLHEGRHFSFLRDEVELPNGFRTFRDVVRHPGAVAIVPVLPEGRVVMVRQYRYAASKELLEIPAGTLEPGEPVIDCAQRELIEETGYEAGTLKSLLSCYMAPGYSSEVIHFFVASDLREAVGEAEPDEEISVERLEPGEVVGMIAENVIEDAKTIIGVLSLSKETAGS